jgi:hypothetical protein
MKRGFLEMFDLRSLLLASPLLSRVWSEYIRVKNLDWTPLCGPNPQWQVQTQIDESGIDIRMAMLFHYDMDLAAVQCRLGGNHVGAHRDVSKINDRVRHLLDPNVLANLKCILLHGCPAEFNAKGMHQVFLEMLAEGSHLSVTKNLDKVMKTMNKEDQKDHVLTFPAWLARFFST